MGTSNPYTERLPSHYCLHCTHVVFEEERACPECKSKPPTDGWTSIQDGFDRWLGRVLDGRYLITRLIGQGAMGSVYRAASLGISREFAIKVINFKEGAGGIDAGQIRARLHREIEAIGRLRNPHVVPFYEVIELYDHYVGVVMDYIAGDTLERLVLDEGSLSCSRAVSILRQVANGVHEAHEAGMIHRDLKPENLMVELMPAGDDFAHILDFGIVQLDDGVSMTHGFLGTPLYASPEQSMAGTIDRRSDIYSLGAVLYFMLTGRPPFISGSVYEILQAHVRKPVPTLRDGNPSLTFPEPLEALVAKMLAKSPARRPQTLAEVIATLDDFRRKGILELASDPESMELDCLGAARNTSQKMGHQTDPDGLSESSNSVFESDEYDATGPMAAIFHRGPSRGAVRRLIEEQRQANVSHFDRVLEGNTGAHTIGIDVSGRAVIAACSPNGEVVVGDALGVVTLTRSSRSQMVGLVQGLSSLGVNDGSVCAGTRDGYLFELAEQRARKLFQTPGLDAVTAVALDAKDRVWLVGTESGSLFKCDASVARDVWIRWQQGPSISALSVGPRADIFAVARRHGEVEVCSVTNPTRPFARFSIPGPARSLAFSPDGHLIAVVLEDETIVVHVVAADGQRVHSMRDNRNRILALSFTDHDVFGYFQRDEKLYVRPLDRDVEKIH